MTALIATLLAAALYLGGTLYQLHCLRQRQTASPSILRGVGALALIAHAISLYGEIFTGQGLSFGFFHVSSLIAWLVIAVTLVFSLRAPVTSLLLVMRSEEHTSELQSRPHLVCRLLLEKKKNKMNYHHTE